MQTLIPSLPRRPKSEVQVPERRLLLEALLENPRLASSPFQASDPSFQSLPVSRFLSSYADTSHTGLWPTHIPG